MPIPFAQGPVVPDTDPVRPDLRPVYWIGSLSPNCQVSNEPYGDTMYDAKIPGLGWANICEAVFTRYGCQLGTGKGQKYAMQADGRWLKVAG